MICKRAAAAKLREFTLKVSHLNITKDALCCFPAIFLSCQLLCILHSISVLLELTRNDAKPRGVWLASWSSPACGSRVKLENGSRQMVGSKAAHTTQPVDAALRTQARCSGPARAGFQHFIGNPLRPPDVLSGSGSPAIKAIYSCSQGLRAMFL